MDIATFTSHRRVLQTAGGDIAYTEWGTGPAAVFVHGAAVSGALWRHVIEQVSDMARCIAVDLPGHGGTPAREDPSITGMAQLVIDLCQGLGLDKVDLVANDTGGAIAQLVAARRPDLLRSFALTNCDSEGNFPPPEFTPVVEQARQGALAPFLNSLAGDPTAARNSPIGALYEEPDKVPDDAWLEYLASVGPDMDRARYLERILAAFEPAQMAGVNDKLRALDVPTLLVWGTSAAGFDIEWAYRLRDLIPGAREVIEVKGGSLFFPEERPADLADHLRRHWAR